MTNPRRWVILAILGSTACYDPVTWGLVVDEGTGETRPPTTDEAYRALRNGDGLMAVAVLRQIHEKRSPAELQAFATRVGYLLVEPPVPDGDDPHHRSAALALHHALARWQTYGKRYRPAFDQFVRVYETRAARMAGGGRDPIYVAHRSGDRETVRSLERALRDIHSAEPNGRGKNHLRRLAASIRPPPPCRRFVQVPPPGYTPDLSIPPCPNHSAWCVAVGRFMTTRDGDLRRPSRRFLRNAPAPDLYERLCEMRLH
ncbi:hypothetical protein [Candidatus Palauibacter sp.]|uniref:hypothetical protein n=1 Tax=Candidatus Palauibacter sp. TaxID=3101350 RepID=UPI003AF1FA24